MYDDDDVLIKRFDPLPDITAFELATIVSNMPSSATPIGRKIQFMRWTWDLLDPTISRHFKDYVT